MIKWLDIAYISGKHGTKGRLVVSHSANLPFICEEGMEFHLVPPKIDIPRVLHLSYFQEIGSGVSQIEFDEIDSIDMSEAVIGCHLLINSELVSHLEAFDDEDISGLSVIDGEAGYIGCVSEIVDNGYQRLLVVTNKNDPEQTHEILLPFVDELIERIDECGVYVNCPKGLIELGGICE